MIEALEAFPYIGGIALLILGGALLDQIGDRIRGKK